MDRKSRTGQYACHDERNQDRTDRACRAAPVDARRASATTNGRMPTAPTRWPATAASSCRCRSSSASIRRRGNPPRSGSACLLQPGDQLERHRRTARRIGAGGAGVSGVQRRPQLLQGRAAAGAATISRARSAPPARCWSTSCRTCCGSASRIRGVASRADQAAGGRADRRHPALLPADRQAFAERPEVFLAAHAPKPAYHAGRSPELRSGSQRSQ